MKWSVSMVLLTVLDGVASFFAVSDFVFVHKFLSAAQSRCGRSECTCNCTHHIAHRLCLKETPEKMWLPIRRAESLWPL